ncbi:MAG TPA: glycoside hydrolase family 9 protein [Rhodanobacteraceae bacterium]
MKIRILCAALACAAPFAAMATGPALPRILVNQVGYGITAPKQAIIQSTEGVRIGSCALLTFRGRRSVAALQPAAAETVDHWHDWRFQTLDFSGVTRPGRYVIQCTADQPGRQHALASSSFRIQRDVLERHTLADVLAYFKASRVSGANERADEKIGFMGEPQRAPIDAAGGWYDATGDYGVHFSQLSYTSYFNTVQVPLVAYALGRTYELLKARDDVNFTQIERHLIDGATYGADFLVRMHPKDGSFYGSICAPGPGKRPQDRRICPQMTSFALKKTADSTMPQRRPTDRKYQVSFRAGGGFAVAALALAARLPDVPRYGRYGNATYLHTAEAAFAYLQAHDTQLVNDGKENILDDFEALLAATELYRTTHAARYQADAQKRADALLARLASDRQFRNWWRRGGKGSGPFYSATGAGAPVVALLDYYPLADAAMQRRIKTAVRRSLEFELNITGGVANPFGYARMYVQTRANGRRAQFFFPHDTRAAPWWRGDNARIASLATAARLALPLFANDPAFEGKLRAYAGNQLNWILGLNPYDSSMLQGTGHNNTEYLFFRTWQYEHLPGGIVNGITGAFDSKSGAGIDFNLPIAVTHGDDSWRWNEQWLPHDAWYLLAIAAHKAATALARAAGH